MLQIASMVMFFLAVYGLANAISILKVGRPIRWLAERVPPWYLVEKDGVTVRRSFATDLMSCPPCVSFWIGLAASFFIWSPASLWAKMPEAAFVDGLACTAITWILHVITDRVSSERI